MEKYIYECDHRISSGQVEFQTIGKVPVVENITKIRTQGFQQIGQNLEKSSLKKYTGQTGQT